MSSLLSSRAVPSAADGTKFRSQADQPLESGIFSMDGTAHCHDSLKFFIRLNSINQCFLLILIVKFFIFHSSFYQSLSNFYAFFFRLILKILIKINKFIHTDKKFAKKLFTYTKTSIYLMIRYRFIFIQPK